MLNDKRKSPRRPIRYTAWVALENDQLQGCVLADISETGARIDVENIEAIPEHFTLLLSSRGAPRRKCRVTWRKDHQVGVEFERGLAQPDQGAKKPATAPLAAATDPTPAEPEAAKAEPLPAQPETAEPA